MEIVNARDARIGDTVFCGAPSRVINITRWLPGTHPDSPIRNNWVAIQVSTLSRCSRWYGLNPEGFRNVSQSLLGRRSLNIGGLVGDHNE
jgi:hypothetical protein